MTVTILPCLGLVPLNFVSRDFVEIAPSCLGGLTLELNIGEGGALLDTDSLSDFCWTGEVHVRVPGMTDTTEFALRVGGEVGLDVVL